MAWASGCANGNGVGANQAGTTSVTTGNVVGDLQGILANQINGTGNITITANGTVTASTGTGIQTRDYVGGAGTASGSITVNAGTTTGRVNGILATNDGAGSLTIVATGNTSSGAVAGTSLRGISATNSGATAGSLSVSATNVTGQTNGLYASNAGSGGTVVNISGNTQGTTAAAIDARDTGAGDLSVTTVGTVSGTIGINANNTGGGNLAITSTALVTGTNGSGVNAVSDSASTGHVISVAGVNGSLNGIRSTHNGVGLSSITASGLISTTSGNGVRADTGSNSSGMAIGVRDINAGGYGIYAIHNGTGNLAITATGALTAGAAGEGIRARTSTISSGMTINVASVNGRSGIDASHLGTADLSIVSTGNIAGAVRGIFATSGAGSSNMTINTQGTTTGAEGMYLSHNGSGSLSVTSAGDVAGSVYSGIFAATAGASLDLAIDAGSADVSGGTFGIRATHGGRGALSITSTGTATGANYFGILAVAGNLSTSMTVSAADVSGGYEGIRAVHYGSGQLSVTASGNASGGSAGIAAVNGGTGATLITVGAGGIAQGGTAGIRANHGNAAAFDIVVNGRVQNSSGATTALAVDAASTGRGVTLQNNSNTIIGTVNLTAADDVFNNVGSWLTAGGTSDFGGGNDLLNNTATGLIDVADVAGTAELTTFNGLEQFTNAGRVSLQDGGVDDRLVTTGNYTGAGGTLLLDAVLQAGGTADVLRVDGNVTGQSLIAVANAGGTGGLTTGDGILVVDVGGTSTTDAFALAGLLNVGTTRYALDFGGAADTNQNWYLVGRANGGDTLWEAVPAIFLKDMPTLQQRVGERLARPDADTTRAPWVRVKGGMGDVDPRLSDAGATWSYASRDLQVGIDSEEMVTNGGAWVIGATAQYGATDADVFNAAAVGTVQGQTYGLGATATWYGTNGVYADFQGQANHVSARFEGVTGDDLASRQGLQSYVLSTEIGWRKQMKDNSVLIPQAQMIWSALDGAAFASTLGSQVDLGDNERLTGRIGLAWEHTRTDGGKYYMLGNLERNLNGQTAVEVDGTASRQTNDATWASLGFGATAAFDDNTSGYFEGSYKAAIGDDSGGNDAFGLTAGLRVQW